MRGNRRLTTAWAQRPPPPDYGREAARSEARRLMEGAAGGAKPIAIGADATAMIRRWRREARSSHLRERLEEVLAIVDAAMASADDYSATAEEIDQRRQSEAQRDALRAIRSPIYRELAGMRVLI